ncbi:hypothetical protein QMK50_20720 [Pseudomonas sp. P5_152]|uniref:hypothetical protein n=1 Tax=Pseudomonas sp. P5_152 TaxID=3043442 RepID=UPI002A35B25F|nr:hypothetical protein [Pseudomonas sp. P5_152]MDX9667386.1 hypothetical protein [Pseudomonas sp. P5_152]
MYEQSFIQHQKQTDYLADFSENTLPAYDAPTDQNQTATMRKKLHNQLLITL